MYDSYSHHHETFLGHFTLSRLLPFWRTKPAKLDAKAEKTTVVGTLIYASRDVQGILEEYGFIMSPSFECKHARKHDGPRETRVCD